MTGRSWWWWLVSGAVVAAVGIIFLVLGLESADRVSSGIGAAASLLGLVAGAAGARRARDPHAPDDRQAVSEPVTERQTGGDPAPRPGVAPASMQATAGDRARIFQAGGDQHITFGRDDHGA
ncbi:hypothetical protein AB0368_34400 [Actinoplanes sp. NPDC051475]|uniref:hypothetical protein n=1 Tax=Actinoplanes sp. NPDC051475 TaxID=3157225 RepID=UPI00344F2753